MLRVYCPKCRTILSAEAIPAGGLARCPACAQVFRTPAVPPVAAATLPFPAPAPAEPAPVLQSAPPPSPAPAVGKYAMIESLEIMDDNPGGETYDVVAELVPPPAPDPVPPDDEVIEAVEEAPEEGLLTENRRPRRKRRRRPRPGVDMPEPERPPRPSLLPGVSNFVLLLIGLAALWFNVGTLALLVPSLAVVPVVAGACVMVAGQVWLLTVAFRDDAVTGFLCLIVPFYALYFLTRNPVEAGRPFVVSLVGWLMLASGIAIGTAAG